VRDRVLAEVASFDAFLFFYTARDESIDNGAYFQGWAAGLGDHDWHPVALPHLHKASSYLFGRRRTRGGPLITPER
jgi:hypothetical protein